MSQNLNMYDIIANKRDGKELEGKEIEFWIDGCVDGQIPDYQTTALLMAIYLNGMTENETYLLTAAMVNSGDVLDLTSIPGTKVDKHSSGGVGDKTTLVVAPMAAAAGLKVAKMSGRGLGHTGGTIDKLEAISGFNVEISEESFIHQVRDFGIALIGQTGQMVPADHKLYALRDVTATVASIPLIAASIMSKKLATGADVIVLDIKYGAGALVDNPTEAGKLAAVMIKIGRQYGKKVSALITAMEQPLGFAVGNALEVEEAIATLQGDGPADLAQLCLAICGEMLYLGGSKSTRAEAYAQGEKLLRNKKAWKQFLTLVNAQGGSLDQVKNGKLAGAQYKIQIGALSEGYIQKVSAIEIGQAARALGAGRLTKDDIIDPNVGIVLAKKVGDYVQEGDILATLYANDIIRATEIGTQLLKVFAIGREEPAQESLIFGIVDETGFTPWQEVEKAL